MNDKVLIKVICIELDKSFDIFIPVNEYIWRISKLIIKSAFNLVLLDLDVVNSKYCLINRLNGKIYKNNEIVIDTDIRNGTQLILVPLDKNR